MTIHSSRSNHATSSSHRELPNSRFKRAAANKASDRINRESRGRLSLSSSSSEDSRISDLEEIKPAPTSSNKKAGSNTKILSSDEEESDFKSTNNKKDNQKTNNSKPVVSSTPVVSATKN